MTGPKSNVAPKGYADTGRKDPAGRKVYLKAGVRYVRRQKANGDFGMQRAEAARAPARGGGRQCPSEDDSLLGQGAYGVVCSRTDGDEEYAVKYAGKRTIFLEASNALEAFGALRDGRCREPLPYVIVQSPDDPPSIRMRIRVKGEWSDYFYSAGQKVKHMDNVAGVYMHKATGDMTGFIARHIRVMDNMRTPYAERKRLKEVYRDLVDEVARHLYRTNKCLGDRELMHYDIKPANVLYTPLYQPKSSTLPEDTTEAEEAYGVEMNGFAVLADYGVFGKIDDSMMIGTPSYMGLTLDGGRADSRLVGFVRAIAGNIVERNSTRSLFYRLFGTDVVAHVKHLFAKVKVPVPDVEFVIQSDGRWKEALMFRSATARRDVATAWTLFDMLDANSRMDVDSNAAGYMRDLGRSIKNELEHYAVRYHRDQYGGREQEEEEEVDYNRLTGLFDFDAPAPGAVELDEEGKQFLADLAELASLVPLEELDDGAFDEAGRVNFRPSKPPAAVSGGRRRPGARRVG